MRSRDDHFLLRSRHRRSFPSAFCFWGIDDPKAGKSTSSHPESGWKQCFGGKAWIGGEVTPTASQNITTHPCAHQRSPPAAVPGTGMGAAGTGTALATGSIDRAPQRLPMGI